ncbi:hypothetical protein D3C75_363340 [compost metagenome]
MLSSAILHIINDTRIVSITSWQSGTSISHYICVGFLRRHCRIWVRHLCRLRKLRDIRILLHTLPVVFGNLRITIHDVPIYKQPGFWRYFPKQLIFYTGVGVWTIFIIIVSDIISIIFCSPTIGRSESPVIDNVIRHFRQIHQFGQRRQTGVAAGAMSNQIVKETGIFATPDSSVAVTSLLVCRHQHTFSGYRPLHSSILVIIQTDHFIHRPAE